MALPSLVLSSSHVLSSLFNMASYSWIDSGRDSTGFGVVAGEPDAAVVPVTEPFVCEGALESAAGAFVSKAEDAMSSRREVAASSLRMKLVNAWPWTVTGMGWARGSWSGLLMVAKGKTSPLRGKKKLRTAL